MLFKRVIGALILARALFSPVSARAQEEPSRPLVTTVDVGLCVPSSYHMHADIGMGTPLQLLYLGLTSELRLRGPVDLSASIGAGCSGLLLGATGRIGTDWNSGVRWTAGTGPLLMRGDFGSAIFAQGDGTLEVRSNAGFVFALSLKLAVALGHAGSPSCGVYTCEAYVVPGDRVLLLRAGVGFNL